MEKKGYIERVSVESDARLKKLILTEKAKEIQKKNRIDIYNNVEKKLTQEIAEEELKVFFKVLIKMKQNFMKMNYYKKVEKLQKAYYL